MDEVDDWMKWMIGWNGWTDERRNLLPRVRNGSINYSEINSDLPIRRFHSYIQKLNRRQLYYWINVAKRNTSHNVVEVHLLAIHTSNQKKIPFK